MERKKDEIKKGSPKAAFNILSVLNY